MVERSSKILESKKKTTATILIRQNTPSDDEAKVFQVP